MTDQEKKSLRSFLKEMEAEQTAAHNDTHSEIIGVRVSGLSRYSLAKRLLESYKETFAEDLFPTCERCNLPVSDEDSAGPGSNMHMSCYDKMLDEGE